MKQKAVKRRKSEAKMALKRKIEGRNEALRSLRSLHLFTLRCGVRGSLLAVARPDAEAEGLSLVLCLRCFCSVRPPLFL